MPELNERIKELRKKHNLTLFDVAEYLGVKEATAQRYESGNIKNIKYETICKLAELFECEPQYLLGWCNDNPGTYNSTIMNSSVVNGNNSTTFIVPGRSNAPIELSDQAVELLRIYNSLSVKGQTLLLARAFEFEEEYGQKE